jgi:hypothetical protein
MRSKVWNWGTEEISQTDRVKHDVLQGFTEEMNILHARKRRSITEMVTYFTEIAF